MLLNGGARSTVEPAARQSLIHGGANSTAEPAVRQSPQSRQVLAIDTYKVADEAKHQTDGIKVIQHDVRPVCAVLVLIWLTP